MPLILAIEPDRRQASRVTALTREALQAELLVADSSEHGVVALGGRVPDLILTSRLLSPKDEAGLRALDRAGVPVPTLMIPVLASPSHARQERAGGLLARMPWSRQASASIDAEGCDPGVFASQIAEYLAEVREIREAPAAREAVPVQEVMEAAPIEVLQPLAEIIPAESLAAIPVVETLAARPAPPLVEEAEVIEEPMIVEEIVMEVAGATIEWEDVELEEDEDAPIELTSEAIDLQAFVDELNATYADLFPRDVPAPPARVAPEHAPSVRAIYAEPAPSPDLERVPEPEMIEIAAAAPALSAEASAQAEPHRPAIAHALPMFAAWPRVEGEAADETPLADIEEIVADFAAALECVEDEPDTSGDADSDLWTPLGTAPGVVWPRLDSTCSRERPRPAQDEWGFFDPDQCGFSALVAKLDSIAR